jgi:FMN-dependent NADH-azoreductase
LLNIQSSPRGERSVSIAVADAFLEAYRKTCPELVVDTLNVWQENLPEFGNAAIGAKYKGINGKPMDEVEAAVWDRIQVLAARFKWAERMVIGVPMWNFGYPYKLKHLIDLVSQRNMLFTYDGRVYGPLLKTPRALVIYARGGMYGPDLPTPPARFDHQTGFFNHWLSLIGVQEIRTLIVESTSWAGREVREQSVQRAKAEAAKIVATF